MKAEMRSRRATLRSLTAWAGYAAAGGIAPLFGCGGRPNLTPLTKLAELPDGTVVRTKLNGEPIMLLHVDGAVRALSGLCTHESCELGWNPEQRLIRCPCHGSAFDPTGKVVKGPALESLPLIPIEVRNGTIWGLEPR
jgi:cytochrome b6-f complex iron-sulfur subunit